MKKLLLIALPVMAVFLGLPILALMVLTTTTAATDCQNPQAATGAGTTTPASTSDVYDQLMRLRFSQGHPRLTAEQANNAIVIAQVARDLNVPRRGLEIAIAAAIQESKLVNVEGGHADSGGLFQQRPSAGWGTRAQITNPGLAASAFFGRAEHTDNPGLLDIPGWTGMPLTQAASAVQNPRADLRGAYARWEPAAAEIVALLGGELPQVASTATAGDDCAPPHGCAAGASSYDLGAVQPQLTHLVDILGPKFGIDTVGGYRASATDPDGHPAGLAADFMISSKAQGDALAAYAREHAAELGIAYIIWWQRIWSTSRVSQGWRPMPDRGGDTENHRDHVHMNALPNPASVGAGSTACGDVVYPVPTRHVGADAGNWHDSGRNWGSWHTGTDLAAPCGTPVYAAHGGIIEVDTRQAWAGRWLVKVTTGANSLTTWYAHMQQVTVSRGQTVRPGQQIGVLGEEGNSTGCHLHFEVHLANGSIYGPDNVDPSTWLAEHAHRQQPQAAR